MLNLEIGDSHTFTVRIPALEDPATPTERMLGVGSIIRVDLIKLNGFKFQDVLSQILKERMYVSNLEEVLACKEEFSCYGHILLGPLRMGYPELLKDWKSRSSIHDVDELLSGNKCDRCKNQKHRLFLAVTHPKHCNISCENSAPV